MLPRLISGRWETWGGRNVLPFWQYCRNKHFDQYWYYGQNWYFCQIDIFVKIDIFIKIDIFVKIDNSVKIVFLTISSTVFDDFINYRQLYQLLIFSSTIWSKYQMFVPVNCNLANDWDELRCFVRFYKHLSHCTKNIGNPLFQGRTVHDRAPRGNLDQTVSTTVIVTTVTFASFLHELTICTMFYLKHTLRFHKLSYRCPLQPCWWQM